jgi:hypothetical protein
LSAAYMIAIILILVADKAQIIPDWVRNNAGW